MSENDNRFDWPNSNGGECPLCGMSCSASNTPDDVFGADIECNDCSFSCSDVDLNTAKYKTDLAAAQAEIARLTAALTEISELGCEDFRSNGESVCTTSLSRKFWCGACIASTDLATDKEKNIVPTIEEMTGLIDYGGRVIFEDGEPMVIPMPEGAKR